MSKPFVSVIITAYNEENTIGKVIKDIKKIKSFKIEIIVVDDGSKDKTKKVATQSGIDKIISYSPNRGKGAAFREGIKKATGEYIIQIDADYQFLPQEIPKIIGPLRDGFDISLGTRYEKDSIIDEDSVNYFRRVGSYFLSLVTSLCAGKKITDVMAGFKGFKRSVLKEIKPTKNHFGYEAEIVIKAAKKGYKIKNIPISYKRRQTGKSNVNSVKDGLLVLQTIIQTGLGL